MPKTTLDPVDVQLNHENISKLSKLPFNWKDVGRCLLGDESVQKIERELMHALTEDEKKIKVLSMWLENNKGKLAYSELEKLLERMKNNDAADGVKQLLTSNEASKLEYILLFFITMNYNDVNIHPFRSQRALAINYLPKFMF